jgi:hypothetical protein
VIAIATERSCELPEENQCPMFERPNRALSLADLIVHKITQAVNAISFK